MKRLAALILAAMVCGCKSGGSGGIVVVRYVRP
jgi:hypothetical protein